MPASQRLIVLAGLSAMMAALAGCAAFNRPYPAKRCFALDIAQRPEPLRQPTVATMRVRQFRVAPPYHQQQFVYKLGESEFTRDYYHEFIAPPAALITDQAISWLGESGVFRATCHGTSAADHDLVLEAVVTGLYGDYTDASNPTAVVAIHFFVLAEEGARTSVVFDQAYSEHISLGSHEPDRLAHGWSEGLQRILACLETDLRPAPSVSISLATPGTERAWSSGVARERSSDGEHE
ncbi:MAG: hypothetical protein IPM18_12495 [Phycisphaerales bacterium]|nr:hypothetical protein [Phycisphaerales bacterium]